MQGGSEPFVYDYMLKDHLGNVRMVLTEEVKSDPKETLTFEDQNIQQQNDTWDDKNGQAINVSFVRTDVNGNYMRMINKTVGPVGTGKLLKVMAGDRIHTKVDYYYPNGDQGIFTNPLNAIVSSLIGSLSGSSTGILSGGESVINTQLGADPNLSALVSVPQNPDGSGITRICAQGIFVRIVF